MDWPARVLTVSDAASQGRRDDTSGPALVEMLTTAGFRCEPPTVIPDGIESVADALRAAITDFAGLILTTGGTGFSPSDLTPEGTRLVIERDAPGLAEATRAGEPLGALSRGIAGTTGRCIIVNLPGSPRGATESLAKILDVVPHALALANGEQPHQH